MSTKLLDQFALINIEHSVWCGQTVLPAAEMNFGSDGEVPDSRVVKGGAIRIVSIEALRPFGKIKTKTRRYMEKFGRQIMSGAWAIPLARVDEAIMGLDALAVLAEKEKSKFLAGYSDYNDEWLKEDCTRAYRQTILRKKPTVEFVETRFGFDYQTFRFSGIDDSSDKKLEKKAHKIAEELIDEVIALANVFYANKLHNKEYLTYRSRDALIELRNKVHGLSFIQPTLIAITGLLNTTIDVYQNRVKGRVIAPDFHQVMATVLILCSKDKITEYHIKNMPEETENQPTITSSDSEPFNIDEIDDFFADDVETDTAAKKHAFY
jgi:hypothetical protein